MSKLAASIRHFIAEMKRLELAPAYTEATDLNGAYIVNVFDRIGSSIITDSVCTGVSTEFETALMKANVEWLERRAFEASVRDPLYTHFGNRSDGCAAYPLFYGADEARQSAKRSAYLEAVERFAWATWWDQPQSLAYIDRNALSGIREAGAVTLLTQISAHTPFEEFVEVRPTLSDPSVSVVIHFAKLKGCGWISGGAACENSQLANGRFRSLSEMFRHSLATFRMNQSNLEPATFYEKRLQYFSSGQGDAAVEQRLLHAGEETIVLPPSALDLELSHPASSLVAAHRFLFQNQPPFVGGALERFCL